MQGRVAIIISLIALATSAYSTYISHLSYYSSQRLVEENIDIELKNIFQYVDALKTDGHCIVRPIIRAEMIIKNRSSRLVTIPSIIYPNPSIKNPLQAPLRIQAYDFAIVSLQWKLTVTNSLQEILKRSYITDTCDQIESILIKASYDLFGMSHYPLTPRRDQNDRGLSYGWSYHCSEEARYAPHQGDVSVDVHTLDNRYYRCLIFFPRTRTVE